MCLLLKMMKSGFFSDHFCCTNHKIPSFLNIVCALTDRGVRNQSTKGRPCMSKSLDLRVVLFSIFLLQGCWTFNHEAYLKENCVRTQNQSCCSPRVTISAQIQSTKACVRFIVSEEQLAIQQNDDFSPTRCAQKIRSTSVQD